MVFILLLLRPYGVIMRTSKNPDSPATGSFCTLRDPTQIKETGEKVPNKPGGVKSIPENTPKKEGLGATRLPPPLKVFFLGICKHNKPLIGRERLLETSMPRLFQCLYSVFSCRLLRSKYPSCIRNTKPEYMGVLIATLISGGIESRPPPALNIR